MYSRGGDGASSVVNEAAVDTLVPGGQDTGRGAAGGRSGFPADSPRAAAPRPLSVRAPVSFLLRCVYTWKPSMNSFCSEGHGDGRGGRGALRPSVSGVRPKCFFSFFQGKNKMISVLLGRGDVRMLLFLFPFVVVWHFFHSVIVTTPTWLFLHYDFTHIYSNALEIHYYCILRVQTIGN